MKNLKLLAVALVAMLGFAACDKDCDHNFIEHDFTNELVGTWTYFAENGQAEAMEIKEDGSFAITGIMQGGSLYEEKGTIKVVNNKVTLAFEGDKDTFEGRLELVAGKSMSIVMFNDDAVRLTYDYCENDLSDEIIGMWVCNDGVAGMAIQTYQEDGKCIYTGFSLGANDYVTNYESTYEVFGDMLFQKTGDRYFATRLTYLPNGNSLGDILTTTSTILINDKSVTSSYSFLRIKQNLELAGNAYDYNNTYVSNVKGLDEDMTMMGYTFNIGKMEGKNLDKMLKTLLFAVEFPNANTLKYQYHYNGQNIAFEARIVVDGNKVTIKMSEMHPYYRDVDMYMFQDKDNTQLHMYMPTSSFINYFGNMDVAALAYAGEIDVTDAAAVEAIFDRMDERVESINVSFVFKARK